MPLIVMRCGRQRGVIVLLKISVILTSPIFIILFKRHPLEVPAIGQYQI